MKSPTPKTAAAFAAKILKVKIKSANTAQPKSPKNMGAFTAAVKVVKTRKK